MRQQLAPDAASLLPFNSVQNSGIFFKKSPNRWVLLGNGLNWFFAAFFYVNGDC